MRIVAMILCCMLATGCGHRAGLKTPSQVAAQKQKAANEAAKKQADEAKKAQEAKPEEAK